MRLKRQRLQYGIQWNYQNVTGLIEYFAQSNDNGNSVEPELQFKFVDDLSILELFMVTGLMTEYNFKQHVANNFGIEEKYIPATSLKTQSDLDILLRRLTQT